MRAETPEEPGMAPAVPIVGGIAECRSLDGLAAASALHRCRVNEKQIVMNPGALGGKTSISHSSVSVSVRRRLKWPACRGMRGNR